MTLLDDLAAKPQRENAGSRTLDRYDFQTCWGISHLLSLHQSGAEYAIAFEFHDDIVVIDSATAATKIRFYQVKTKSSGNWTLNKLMSRPTDGGLSIVGKLFDNKQRFPQHTEALGFVSNQPLNFIDESKYPCCFSEAEKSDFDRFVKKLQEEHAGEDASSAKLLNFHKTEFGISGYDLYLKGQILDFVTSECGGQLDGHYNGFYLSVIDQCRRKAKHLRDITSVEDLLKSKFVTRADVAEWIERLKERASKKPDWSAVLHDITDVVPAKKRAIKAQWDKYSLETLQVSNASLMRLRDYLRTLLETVQDDQSLNQIVEALLPRVRSHGGRLSVNREDDYFRAMILYEFYAS